MKKNGTLRTPKEDAVLFTKWVKARPDPWFPVPLALTQTLCELKSSVSSETSDNQATSSPTVPNTPQPCKRKRSTTTAPCTNSSTPVPKKSKPQTTSTPTVPNTPQPCKRTRSTTTAPCTNSSPPVPKKSKRKLRKQLPKTQPDDDNDLSATDCSSSDDGNLEREWVNEAEAKWRRRPEPHRSEALRAMAHKMKVSDGDAMEYATLFAWASYQRQAQFGDAIRRIVAMRCVQDKIGERHYRKDVVPHYLVGSYVHTQPTTLTIIMCNLSCAENIKALWVQRTFRRSNNAIVARHARHDGRGII